MMKKKEEMEPQQPYRGNVPRRVSRKPGEGPVIKEMRKSQDKRRDESILAAPRALRGEAFGKRAKTKYHPSAYLDFVIMGKRSILFVIKGRSAKRDR